MASYGTYRPVTSTTKHEVILEPPRLSFGDVLKHFGFSGLYTFGGTGANIALFQQMLCDYGYVTDSGFAEIYALSNCLPGPTATQILLNGVTTRVGPLAGVTAVVLFMGPAALFMGLLGCIVGSSSTDSDSNFLSIPWVLNMQSGVSAAAITIVALGAYQLFKKLIGDQLTQLLFTFTTVTCLAGNEFWFVTPICLVVGGLSTYVAGYITGSSGEADIETMHSNKKAQEERVLLSSGRGEALSSLESMQSSSASPKGALSPLVGGLLFILPWGLLLCTFVIQFFDIGNAEFETVAIFFRAGSLVFGGGPVVVPLLLTQLVPPGLLTQTQFLLGFGAVNLMPGPMFNVAAFCGGVIGGWRMAVACWGAAVLPGIFMSLGALPFWKLIRTNSAVKQVLKGVNATAAGLMCSAFLLLWLKIINNSSSKAAFVVLLLAIQLIFRNIKAPHIIAFGGIAGIIYGIIMGE